jgi:DNA-binding transcriptional ArsR family regulator
MTLYALRQPGDLLAVRFACSPIWETELAVRTLMRKPARSYHRPWLELVGPRLGRLDLEPLFAVLPLSGSVPDFLTPPPRSPRPRLRDQLAEVRATPPDQVARELERCRETVDGERYRVLLDAFLADPGSARDLLAARLHEAWTELVAPFWIRIRTLLDRDIEERARELARYGLRRVLDGLHPRVRWTRRGLSCADRSGHIVEVDERGLVLMPSAYLGNNVAAIVDEPWLPTIVYPVRGIASLWRAPSTPPDGLARLFGRTRALVLASLDRPRSTTSLAALIELSPAGVSRHLLALRGAGLVSAARHGHEVRYRRTKLGSELLRTPDGASSIRRSGSGA